jgi:SHS2 domain-containing protein
VDHTADAGIVVTADSRSQLFERAAVGMFTILTEPEKLGQLIRREVEVEGEDLESLMLNWLSELNFLHITERELFGSFKIRHLAETVLNAEIGGELMDPAKHVVYTEIKAVTFHELEIHQVEGQWRAQVIFDL